MQVGPRSGLIIGVKSTHPPTLGGAKKLEVGFQVIVVNFKLGGVVGGRVGGGFHPNNQATSWPNLHVQDKQDFNSSSNCKLGPSVAIIKARVSTVQAETSFSDTLHHNHIATYIWVHQIYLKSVK